MKPEMQHAEVRGGIVVALRSAPYPVDNPWTIPCGMEVHCGWSYDGETWTPSLEHRRTATRAAMREQWDGLPAWIRGPFQSLFAAANALLDAGDDDAAAEMIRYAVPPSGYTPEQARAFAQVKQQFASAFAALKG